MKKTIFKSALITFLSASCIMAFMAGSLSIANANKSNISKLNSSKKTTTVNLMLGKADMVNIGGEIADVMVADPSIVDVMAVKSNRLYLVGSTLGDTNIMALDADGNVLKRINIHVKMDTAALKSMVKDLYPNETVNIRALSDQVVLTGEVSNPSVANKITNLVGRYAVEAQGGSGTIDGTIVNMLAVRGEQQVMLKVKIIEASRDAVKNLGINFQSLGGANIGDLTGTANSVAGLGLSAPQQIAQAVLNYSSGTFGNLGLLVQALEQEGIMNTLAEPNLTAISGEQAGFLAGGEFPIPTQIDRNGNIVYEFKPFGVSLNFKPIVMSKERISLQMKTEVSTTSFAQNLQLNGVNIPTFNIRRAETNVEMGSGETLMIAGLIQSNSVSSLSQLPGIGDVPVMGDLIKSDSFQRSESEVLVMITPYLVKPFAQNQTASNAVFDPVPPSAAPKSPTLTQSGPELNYGAIIPDDTNLPRLPPEDDMGDAFRQPTLSRKAVNATPASRQMNKSSDFFDDNIRRLYGKDAPESLLNQGASFGYVFD